MALRSMGQNSPHLQHLAIHPRDFDSQFAVNLPIIEIFEHVPLKSLNLAEITYDPSGYGDEHSDYEGDAITESSSPETQWTAFLTAVPYLEELNLDRQDLPPEYLHLFASFLPHLQLLVIKHARLDEIKGAFDDVDAPQSMVIRSRLFFGDHYPRKIAGTPDESSIANAARKDYVNLIYLCRDIYAWLLPMVWEEVDLIYVLILIPGAWSKSGGRDASIDLEYCTELEFTSAIDLTRFNVHSPLVKTVKTGELYEVKFPATWPSLGQEGKPDPLFPNLQRLVINSVYGLGEECLIWWRKLFSPDLLELRMLSLGTESESEFGDQYEECPGLGTRAGSELIDELSRNCPRLEVLRLFPADYEKNGQGGYYPLYDRLANFASLQSFSLVVADMHSDLFLALGQLPHLQSLSLRDSGCLLCTEDPITVPEDSFPCLQHLALLGLAEDTIARICKVAPLFRRLITAKVATDDYTYENYVGDHKRSIMAVESMGPNSPYLRDLTIHPRGHNGGLVVSSPIVDSFKYMPLTRLDLGVISFNNTSDHGDDAISRNYSTTTQWTTFLTAIPFLEEFHLGQQYIEAKYFRLFASLLPRLRLLVVASTTFDATEDSSDGVRAQQSITIHSRFHLKSEPGQKMIHILQGTGSKAARSDATLPNEILIYETLEMHIERLRHEAEQQRGIGQ
ncbi:hypothetical protein FRC07_007290, partial [Ceratobasidium sp. 392]